MMKTNILNQRGFSLIEVLVSLIALGFVVFAASSLLLSTIQNTDKTTVIGTIKENGQNVLDELTTEIRSADSVACVGDKDGTIPTSSSILEPVLVIFENGQYIRYRIVAPTNSDNGFLEKDYPDSTLSSYLPNGPINPMQPGYNNSIQKLCDFNSFPYSNGQILTDTDPVSGVSLQLNSIGTNEYDNGFSVSSGFSDALQSNRPLVTVKINLMPGINAGSKEQNQIGSNGVSFQTSVQLR